MIKKILEIYDRGLIDKPEICLDPSHLNRGWYICFGMLNYLYTDGVLRNNVAHEIGSVRAWWPTEKMAKDFYNEWRGLCQ